MRILIYPGSATCANLGDVAMLQVAVERLRSGCPAAELRVLTRSPENLAAHCPGVIPVMWPGCKRWLRVGVVPPWFRCHRRPAERNKQLLSWKNFWRLGGWLYPPDYRLAREFAEALFGSDLLVLSGCGILTDVFHGAAMQILDLFAAAQEFGIPTAMIGQGIGPLLDPLLLRRAAEVLPRLNMLFLREGVSGLALLRRMQMPPDRIVVTGDDALTLAFRQAGPGLGPDLGFNVRVASYSGIDGVAQKIRDLLFSKARQYRAALRGVPVSCRDHTSDVQTLESLCVDESRELTQIRSVRNLINQISRCRLIVTGSYHAGVFALAQGIPTIGLVGSSSYQEKFSGLADLFGSGCRMVRVDDLKFLEELASAVDVLWSEAERLRPDLLRSAARQIQLGDEAYARLIREIQSRDPLVLNATAGRA